MDSVARPPKARKPAGAVARAGIAAALPLRADGSTLARSTPLQREHLAAVLQALSSEVRLELVSMLGTAHTLGDIRIRPRRNEQGERPDRPMSGENVRRHLERLIELGIVRVSRRLRDGRAVDHYQVNRMQVFALTEQLRSLALLPAGGDLLDGTILSPGAPSPRLQREPHFVLVGGLDEGMVFPLRAPQRRWLIGRAEDADVRLAYDGYVSLRNSVLTLEGDQWMVEDRAGSRNGTHVNWVPLPANQRMPLRHGDVLGVGRSLLLLRH